MPSVELRDISKRYSMYERPVDRLKEMLWRNRRCFHKEYWALRNVSLTVERGVTTAILGPNGSGKSTLLQIIAGVLQPTSGSVSVNGRLTAILELGAGFQAEYTGRENVVLGGMILGIPREEMLERMDSIAEFAEIGEFFDQPVKTYSSGMVVRLAFASCIHVDPEVLLVDEALAVGDSRFQTKCIAHIQKMQAHGKTIIFVTHDVESVRRFCQQAMVLNGGQMMAAGAVEDAVPVYEELMESGAIAPKHFSMPAAARAWP